MSDRLAVKPRKISISKISIAEKSKIPSRESSPVSSPRYKREKEIIDTSQENVMSEELPPEITDDYLEDIESCKIQYGDFVAESFDRKLSYAEMVNLGCKSLNKSPFSTSICRKGVFVLRPKKDEEGYEYVYDYLLTLKAVNMQMEGNISLESCESELLDDFVNTPKEGTNALLIHVSTKSDIAKECMFANVRCLTVQYTGQSFGYVKLLVGGYYEEGLTLHLLIYSPQESYEENDIITVTNHHRVSKMLGLCTREIDFTVIQCEKISWDDSINLKNRIVNLAWDRPTQLSFSVPDQNYPKIVSHSDDLVVRSNTKIFLRTSGLPKKFQCTVEIVLTRDDMVDLISFAQSKGHEYLSVGNMHPIETMIHAKLQFIRSATGTISNVFFVNRDKWIAHCLAMRGIKYEYKMYLRPDELKSFIKPKTRISFLYEILQSKNYEVYNAKMLEQ